MSQSRPASVAVVGDSLIHQSIGEISDDLSSVGIRATVFGDPGHPLTSPSIVDRIAEAAADPAIRVVVIATASNDNLANARRAREVGEAKALAEYRQLVESALASLGGRCVVLVDARAASSRLYEPEFAPRTDGELRRISTERPDTVLVDWSAISAPHADDWFVADELPLRGSPVATRSAGTVTTPAPRPTPPPSPPVWRAARAESEPLIIGSTGQP